MTVARTTTLAFGASLLGSATTLLIYLTSLTTFQRELLSFLLVAGILFIAHGTGYLLKGIGQLLTAWREHHPAIGIINDLPWMTEGQAHAWGPPQMSPQEWKARLSRAARNHNVRAKVTLIRSDSKLFGYKVDRYNVILNPYGSAYPESDVEELTTWRVLSSYVLRGGTVANFADIPFFCAYDKDKGNAYELSKPAYHFIPTSYRLDSGSLKLEGWSYQPISPFAGTPFLNETRVEVLNTETGTPGSPRVCILRPKRHLLGEKKEWDSVRVNRAIRCNTNQFSNVESIVEEIGLEESRRCTPLCYINYGQGRFLVSTLFLAADQFSDERRGDILDFLTRLAIEETRRTFMERKDKAQKSANDVAIMADYIAKALSMSYPPSDLKVVLNVPLKQLDDEVQTLKAYVNALK